MQKNLDGQIDSATKWSSITEIVARLISPLVNMILARLLTPEAFGVVATITMVISFVEIFTDAGFQKYIIQHEFENEEELNNTTNVAFWTNLTFSVLICGVIWAFRHSIARMVGTPYLGNSISMASVLILIAAFSSIQMARFKRAFDFKALFYARMGMSLIPLVVTVPLAFVFKNYWAILIGNFASQLVGVIILSVKSSWKPSLYFNFSLLKEMFSFSSWTLLEAVSIWLTNYIGIFIVGNYLSEYYLGIYKTTMSTVNSYMAIITGAITPVLFSALSRYQNDNEKFEQTYYQMQRKVAILVFPMGIGLFLYQDVVTRVLLGSQWMEAAGFIGLWGLMSAFAIVFSHFSSEVFRSKGNPKISLLLQLIHLAFLVPSLLMSAKHGFTALYIVRSLVRVQIIATAMVLMKVLYKFEFARVVKNVCPMLISSIIMGIVGYCLQQINYSILWSFVSIFICVIVYFTVLLCFFPKTRDELFETKWGKRIVGKMIKQNKLPKK